MKCSTNNRADTVYGLFRQAIRRYGLPSRVRCDYGGENHLVALHMIHYRGIDRNSMITGSSTHNQRIERLWRDMHRSVTVLFYRLFYFLEHNGLLDPLNEKHLFALQYVFLPRINRALEIFHEGWNSHGIRTEHHLSPQQLFTAGALRLRTSGLDALDFFDIVDEDYGVSLQDPQPEGNDHETIAVPQSRFVIPQEDMLALQERVNPLANSDNYGINIYLDVLQFLVNY